MRKLSLLLIAIFFTCTAIFFIATKLRAASQSEAALPTTSDAGSLSYFTYQDNIPNLKATIQLPGSADEWGVQNPYKNADQSLIKSPQVFVKAAFQSIKTPALYGIIRVVYDLKGLDCYTVFTGLAQLDGLRLQTYSGTSSVAVSSLKGYVFEYYQDQKHLIVGSRVVCDDKYGLELMVVAPDAQQYGPTVQQILNYSQLTIPTSTGG